jgi:putative endonuclease
LSWIDDGSTQDKGQTSENFARKYLVSHGLQYVTKNYRNRQGEIDIIFLEGGTYVFVEVKYRKNNKFGGAISAVSYKKTQKIKQCAKFYLQQNDLNEYNTPCRFDIIALEGNINRPQITWLKNAF